MRAHCCPRCGQSTYRADCCGIIFPARRKRWRMSKALIKRIHVDALVRKRLTEGSYRARLNRFGVQTCKDLTQTQYHMFMRELAKLPDAPPRTAREIFGSR